MITFIIERDITIIGLIFWVVMSKKKFFHESPSTKAGIQLWRGAAPTFSNKANKRITELTGVINILDNLARIIIEAIAWIIKYLIATSLWYFLDFLKIKGINIRTLISKHSQINSHEFEEIINTIDRINKIKKIKFAGWKKI